MRNILADVMPKTFNLITNLNNGAGLQRDYEILRALLEGLGHTVYGHDYRDLTMPRHVDINIYFEVLAPHTFGRAKEDWFFPNSEWYFPNWDLCINRFIHVLCKTQDCLEIWKKKVGNRAEYVGFESLDFFQPQVPRQLRFLHLAGRSMTKNTEAVVAAWRNHKLLYPLTVVAYPSQLTGDEVVRFMNEHTFHVMPSLYEGFGHVIHEALGTGGIVITTDAPPMRDFPGVPKELLVPVARSIPARAARHYIVDPLHVADAVHRAAGLPPDKLRDFAEQARAGFIAGRDEFRSNLERLVGRCAI